MKSLSEILGASGLRDYVRSGMPPALRLGGAFLQLLATVLIARVLGAERAGDFFFWSMTLMTIGQVATFGLDRYTLQQMPRLREEPETRLRLLGAIRATSVVVATGFGGILILYAIVLQPEFDRPFWWYLLPPLCTVGVALCMINGDAMIAMGRPVWGILFRHTFTTSLFVGSAALLAFGSQLTANSALACFSLAFVVAGLGALAVPGFRSRGLPIPLPRWSEFTGLLKSGLPICLSTGFVALSCIIPLAVLEQTHSPDRVAFLTTAFRLFFLFEILANAIHSLALPDLSRAAQEHDRSSLWRVYRITLVRAALMISPALLLMAIFAEPVMGLFGEDFSIEAPPVLRVFLVIGLLSLLFGPANHLILMTGRTREMAAISFARMAATGLAAFAVVPAFGPVGMALVFGAGLLIEKGLYLRGAASAPRPAAAPRFQSMP